MTRRLSQPGGILELSGEQAPQLPVTVGWEGVDRAHAPQMSDERGDPGPGGGVSKGVLEQVQRRCHYRFVFY